MTTKPVEEQTVKALSWQLLYGNYRSKLGADGWRKLAETTGAPDFRHMDSDVDCPMKPFNDAVLYIDRVLGKGDGAMIEEITRASVDRWASIFKNLVQQLQGRPQKMLEIFCTEVHPYFLNDPTASGIVQSSADGFTMRLDNGLLPGFKIGLIEGFCKIVGADAVVERSAEDYRVTWTIAKETPAPSRWALFLNATRAPFLTATAVPVLLGAAVAWKNGAFNSVFNFILTLLGVAAFHVGTNVLNDYFDHTSGADEANFTPTPFGGGSRVIQRGLMGSKSVRNLGLAAYTLGTLIGLYLVLAVGIEILYFGIVGFLVSFLYTAPPVRLAHRGLGELAVAIGFGPIIVLGTYWVQAGQWSNEALIASAPVALLIAAVLYINEFPDRPWDIRAGKMTLVARMPIPMAINGYLLLIAASYLAILLAVIADVSRWPTLIALATLPMAWKAVQGLRQNHSYPYRLIPSNANTVFTHLFTGLLLFAGYVVSGFLVG